MSVRLFLLSVIAFSIMLSHGQCAYSQDARAAVTTLHSKSLPDGPGAMAAPIKVRFNMSNWEALDKQGTELRSGKQSWPTGYWKLDTFYEEVGAGPTSRKGKTDERTMQVIEQMHEWIKAKPSSITARVALANDLHSFAWQARGGGYANTVTDDNHKKMSEREDAALQVLNDARRIKDQCPRGWLVRLKIAKDQGSDLSAYNAIFNKCVSLFPTYFPVYFEKAVALQPRWLGADGDWERFAQESADKIGGADGDALYAQIIWKIDDTGWYKNIFATFPRLDWNRSKRGFEAILTRFPNSVGAMSEFCLLAYYAGDLAQCRELFTKLNGRCDLDNWDSVAQFEAARKACFP